MTTNEEWVAHETDLIYEPILALMETLYGGPLNPKTGPAIRKRIELGLRKALLRGFDNASFTPSATNSSRCHRCGTSKSAHGPSLDCPPWKMVP